MRPSLHAGPAEGAWEATERPDEPGDRLRSTYPVAAVGRIQAPSPATGGSEYEAALNVDYSTARRIDK